MKFLIINGPNINFTGIREQDIYGRNSFAELEKYITESCTRNCVDCELFQSNHEGFIIDKIQQAYSNADGIVINPAAYTHTSIAIMDALSAVDIPCVEVHLSDISKREAFRQISYTGRVCLKTFAGKGFLSYGEAVDYLAAYLRNNK